MLMKDNCLICDQEMFYYFSKSYDYFPESPLDHPFKVDYYRCCNCGFTLSKTHKQMSKNVWEKLNSAWHHFHEKENQVNQPPYIIMALALKLMIDNKLLSVESCLDYAAGYGTLKNLLSRYFNYEIKIYDEYVTDCSHDYQDIALLEKYKLLINTAMFEHVIDRKSLDNVNSLVDDDGVLMLHTYVSEEIPKNPNWFYLTPHVHTAFHTNKSMNILMTQWNYKSSVYCPEARTWFLFKDKYLERNFLDEKIENINREIQRNFFIYKNGFVNYWK